MQISARTILNSINRRSLLLLMLGPKDNVHLRVMASQEGMMLDGQRQRVSTMYCGGLLLLDVALSVAAREMPLTRMSIADSAVDDLEPSESRYLGQNSIAAFLNDEAKVNEPTDEEHQGIRQDIMPILGLQVSSAPYPFMSKDHMDKIRHDIAAGLPPDREVLKYV